MTCPLLHPDDPIDPSRLGGKGAALARMERAGLPIPEWFVVPPDASLDEAAAVIENAARAMAGDDGRLAVRSSARDEDAPEYSFAGQLESYLDVTPADVITRVRDVRASGDTERVRAYRAEHDLATDDPTPAVIVQRMVPARAAGVVFTADPVTGRRAHAVVSAVRGLGDALVSGLTDADTWHVDRDGSIVDHAYADDGNAPALEDRDVQAVAALARRAEHWFGVPQDVEWAIEGDRVFLVQSRPITSLGRVPDPDGLVLLWDNSNIVESYSGVTTPLTFSFARRAYEEVYRQFCRLMRVPDRSIEDNADTFRCMIGLVRGRVYYNLVNWYRVLALLPGFKSNRAFMEQMMGVREALPDAVADELTRSSASAGARWLDRMRLVRTTVGLVASAATLSRRTARFRERLDVAMAPPNPPLSVCRPDELVAHYRTLERRLLAHWDAPLVNDFLAMIAHGVLRKLAGSWTDDPGLHNDLLCGDGDVISAEPVRRMQAMAALIRDNAALVETLGRGTISAVRRAVAGHAELDRVAQEYLDQFGDRCLGELKLESPTLADDPLPLWRGVAALAARPRDEGPEEERPERRLRRDAESRLDRALRGHPFRRLVLTWVLTRARRRVRDRENLRFDRTRVFGRVRVVFVELGKRLAAEGRIAAPRDVFLLTVDEILGAADGSTASARLAEVAEVRRTEFAEYTTMEAPPDRFETVGVVTATTAIRPCASAGDDTNGDTDLDAEERQGLGCSPGIVRGPVRVVVDPRGAEIEPGTILVACYTDPGWVVLFPRASALVVERGSLLSHSAIVARELGLPAVVAVPGVTSWLHDGDIVEMNGATGQVQRLSQAGDAS